VGVAVADTTTGNPYSPEAQGGGLIMAITAGAQVTRHIGLYGVLRTPSYIWKDQMPGVGLTIDWFDFNALVVTFSFNRLTLAAGPSLDIQWPVYANPGIGGGADVRFDFELVHRTENQGARITLGLLFHPSVMKVSEPQGYFSFLKVVWLGGLTLGVQWS
jgi:hypothetical protein